MKVSQDCDHTLYVHWTKYDEYTVTYNYDDGSECKSRKYPSENSEENTLDGSPGVREGYEFEGWKVIEASGNWEKENRLYFSIEKMDLRDFIFDKSKSRGDRYVFKRKNGSGDTLIVEGHRKNR